MPRRRRVREVVIQVLYQRDLNPHAPWPAIERLVGSRLNRDPELTRFAFRLIRGVETHRPEIDQRIADTATNWHLRRIAAIDRAILRLGTYEIMFDQTPGKVAINEAIELAKRFSTAQSAPFVNGILDRILHGAIGPSEEPATAQAASADRPPVLNRTADPGTPEPAEPETETPTPH